MATTIEKQTWLVDTIQRHRKISLKDLSRIWQDNDSLNPEGCELSERTFHRHREEIERIFGISIKFENIPSGQQHLSTLISCMRDSVKVEFTYHNFWRNEQYTIFLDLYSGKSLTGIRFSLRSSSGSFAPGSISR